MNDNGDAHAGVAPPDPQPLFAVIAAYDVTTTRPHRDTTLLFRDIAADAHAEREALRVKNSANEVALASANEQVQWLHRQLATARRAQFLGATLGVVGTILVGFGVNFLTSDKPAPGWVMLLAGVVVELAALLLSFLVRDDSASPVK
jgi:hypothetical protein